MNRKRTNDNLSQSNYLVLTFNLYILKQNQLVLIKILFSIVKLFHGEIDQGTRLYVHNKKLAFFSQCSRRILYMGEACLAYTIILSLLSVF